MSKIKKIPVGADGEALVHCDACGRTKKISGVHETYAGKSVRVKCSCGAVFQVLFERRRYYRKDVNLPGTYARAEVPGWEREMFVEDLSLGGLSFRTVEPHSLRDGDIVKVRFRLNDTHGTWIHKSVVVRSVRDRTVGAEFVNDGPPDRALGFYLLA